MKLIKSSLGIQQRVHIEYYTKNNLNDSIYYDFETFSEILSDYSIWLHERK